MTIKLPLPMFGVRETEREEFFGYTKQHSFPFRLYPIPPCLYRC